MAGHRKARRRFNDPGHAHFLTFSCYRRMRLLSKERPCVWFAEAWTLAAEKHEVDLWACVLMPDHVHLLVYPRRDEYSISALLKTLKPSVTTRALFWLRTNRPEFLDRLSDRQPNGEISYRFWQRGGGHDLNLWDAARIWNHIDYVHDNPVRRGLCALTTDWRWSSAVDFARIARGPILLNHEHLPPDPRFIRRGSTNRL
jgi:putative transposase